jgi:hypothetical protein
MKCYVRRLERGDLWKAELAVDFCEEGNETFLSD